MLLGSIILKLQLTYRRAATELYTLTIRVVAFLLKKLVNYGFNDLDYALVVKSSC